MDWFAKSKNKPKYEGTYNFYLMLNTQSVDSSSSLSITAFTDSKQRAVVPCTYTWFLIKNGITQEVQQFKGSSFICDTSHIGHHIQVHIISNDLEYNGKAIVTLGPVQLDVSLKTDILNTLGQGSGSSAIYLLGPQQQQRECLLKITELQIKIMHSFSDLHYIFDYSILQPSFLPHSKQPSRLTISFGQKYQSQVKKFEKKIFARQQFSNSKSNSSNSKSMAKFQIRFLSRALRDVFLYTIRAFIVKRQLKNSVIIKKIQNIHFQRQQDFDAIVQIDSLKKDLIRYDRNYKQLSIQKKRLQDQKTRIETDYQTLSYHLKDRERSMMASSVASIATRRDHVSYKPQQSIPIQVKKLQKQNQSLNNRIRVLAEEVDRLKTSKVSTVIWNPPIPVNSATAFKKKQFDNESLVNVLQDLNKNDTITHFDYQKNNSIEKLQNEKRVLLQNLQQSKHRIQILQSKLQKSQSKTSLPGINFTYKANSENTIVNDNMKKQNEQLLITNKKLLNQLKKSQQQIQQLKIKCNNINSRNQPTKIENQIAKIRIQNRASENILDHKKQHQKIKNLQSQNNTLKLQIQKLHKNISQYQSEISSLKFQINVTYQKYTNLQKKLKQNQSQLQIYRKSQDTLNRSQNLSMQMQQYNEQQMKILKQHNSFLVAQNEKLIKACEKYMQQARQSNKLRQQILQLKQKLNSKITNIECTSFTN